MRRPSPFQRIQSRRWRFVSWGLATACAVLCVAPAESSAATVTATASFAAAGTYSWTVPAGVTSIAVTAQGAAGGTDVSILGGEGPRLRRPYR